MNGAHSLLHSLIVEDVIGDITTGLVYPSSSRSSSSSSGEITFDKKKYISSSSSSSSKERSRCLKALTQNQNFDVLGIHSFTELTHQQSSLTHSLTHPLAHSFTVSFRYSPLFEWQ